MFVSYPLRGEYDRHWSVNIPLLSEIGLMPNGFISYHGSAIKLLRPRGLLHKQKMTRCPSKRIKDEIVLILLSC